MNNDILLTHSPCTPLEMLYDDDNDDGGDDCRATAEATATATATTTTAATTTTTTPPPLRPARAPCCVLWCPFSQGLRQVKMEVEHCVVKILVGQVLLFIEL